MKRRTYLKSLFAVGAIGVTSFSLFKWIDVSEAIQPDELWKKKAIIAELAEMIIPRTDSPGAKDAQVESYIINVLLNCNSLKQQHKFCNGLEDLEKYALTQYRKVFLECAPDQQLKVLEYSAKHAQYSYAILNKINNKFFGQSFFSKLKDLTVEGYCLSRLGASEGLAYDYIPSRFEACIPLQPNQKSWATK